MRLRPLCLLLLGTTACVRPATEVLCTVDTNIPSGTPITLRIAVTPVGASASTPQWRHTWQVGDDGGISFPESFAVVPSEDHGIDEAVLLRVEAVTPTFTIRRRASFRFVSEQTLPLQIFLNAGCARHESGCADIPDADCTLQQLCEERDQTCNEEAQCVDVGVTPGTLHPFDGSLGEDAPDDIADATVADVQPDVAIDIGVDTPPPPCSTRVTYGALWIHPSGHAAQYDTPSSYVTWDGTCVDGAVNSWGTLSNSWQPVFRGSSACSMQFNYSNCTQAPTACATRITYATAWIHPSGHPAQYDSRAGIVTWDRVCHASGSNSYAVLSNGMRPYFRGANNCGVSLRYVQCSGP